jgi:small multidrug resistance family-3 protein
MTMGGTTLVILVLAAVLEVGGDAAIRHGFVRSSWAAGLLGAAALVAYGVVINTNRSVDFGRLMGVYIVTFFLVSQAISGLAFGERPSLGLLVGGALIVAGGLVIQLSR